jgi:hypothetical protein
MNKPFEVKPIGTNPEKECINKPTSLASIYPKYYKDVVHINEIDVYQVHKLFDIQDTSGAIQHASKKLLLSGVRTGGKSKYDDIREARDTLNRWLQINKPTE